MPFDFNIYSALLLPAFIQGIVFAAILWLRSMREGSLADRLLALLLLVFTLRISTWMLGFAGWYDSHDAYSTFMFYFPFSHWFAIGPLIYFYFRSLTNRDFRLRRADYLHFAPAAAMLLLQAVIFFADVVVAHGINGAPYPDHFGTKGRLADWPPEPGRTILQVLAYVSLGGYFILTQRTYRRYRQYLNANFSETGNKQFLWLRYFLTAVAIVLLAWLLFDLFEFITGRTLSYIQDWYSYLLLGVVIYYLSIAGYGALPQHIVPLQFEPEQNPSDEHQMARNESESLLALQKTLSAHMQHDKPYLQPELTLSELAAHLHLSPGLLSRAINTGFGQNFNEFVNAYRVEAVKQMVVDPKNAHLSILGIAYECGFNSKATFNRAFSKHAGCSPSDFLKAQKDKQVSNQ